MLISNGVAQGNVPRGAPGAIRTHSIRIRSPAELQAGFQPQDYL